MRIKVEINKDYTISRFHSRFQQAQKYLDNEVLKDSDPYVPMDTGNLRNSGIRGTTLGSGQVVYNAPYAQKCYYGAKIHFSPAKHPLATAMWFEKAKAANKKKWFDGVERVIKG